MKPIPNLSLFSGRLFSEPDRSAHSVLSGDHEIARIVGEAEFSIQLKCGGDWALLSPDAWTDWRRGLSEFLFHLLLLRPDGPQLRSAVAAWIEAQYEMLSRLRRDRHALGVWLAEGPDPGPVMALEMGLSDRHNGGRTVSILTLKSGSRVVYKPREMGIEAWYARFVDWLNETGTPRRFRAAGVMLREGYGWMEYVPHIRCQSKEELSGYYRNAGALLCLMHILRARDCHFQNLIACAQEPVLVDAEMLFQAQIAEREPTSVMRTGMIPNFRFGPEGQHYDVSGLGFVRQKATHFQVPEWNEAGVRFRTGVLNPRENVPLREDDATEPREFATEMMEGFRETYRFFAETREAVAQFLRTAAELPVRYLLRETMTYYEAFQSCRVPNGTGTIELPTLVPEQAIFSAMGAEEALSLARFDIPRFTLAANERSLNGLNGCFAQSGLELALAGLEELSEADMAKQTQILKLSWSLSRMSTSLS